MKVITPLAITDAMIIANSALEAPSALFSLVTTYHLGDIVCVNGTLGVVYQYQSIDDPNLGYNPTTYPSLWILTGQTYQLYSALTTYAAKFRVIDAVNHLVYESVASGNLGSLLTDATKWLLIGPTNARAMFNLVNNTATIEPEILQVNIAPGVRINSIALMGMVADLAKITVSSFGEVVYTHIEDLNLRKSKDWMTYFFEPFSTTPSIILFDLPPFSNAVISITLIANSGNVTLGSCVIGNYTDIGDVQYSAQNDVLNFSTVTRDFAGGTALMIQRRNVPKTISSIFCDKSIINDVRKLRDNLNALPAVWAGLNDNKDDYFEATLILGFYKKFSINLSAPKNAIISLELEEI